MKEKTIDGRERETKGGKHKTKQQERGNTKLKDENKTYQENYLNIPKLFISQKRMKKIETSLKNKHKRKKKT